jgi:hypothetical protein
MVPAPWPLPGVFVMVPFGPHLRGAVNVLPASFSSYLRRELGIKRLTLERQVRHRETDAGTAILSSEPGHGLALPPEGERFAREITLVLDLIAGEGH